MQRSAGANCSGDAGEDAEPAESSHQQRRKRIIGVAIIASPSPSSPELHTQQQIIA